MRRLPPLPSARRRATTRRPASGAAAAVLAVALAACSSPSTPGPSAPSPSPSTAPAVTSPGPTTSTVPPTTEPSLPATTSPPGPSARDVPVSTLLRAGTTAVRALYGDLDGDGIQEIVLASRATHPPPGAAFAQGYLDVFSWDGTAFARVLAGTEAAPPGAGAPTRMILKPRPEQVSQEMQFLSLVRFRADGPPDLAVGVLNVGAGAGPLDVWVVSMDADGFHTEFFESTESGGILTTTGTTLRLDTPDYAPSDPHCCPSRIEHQVIGPDASSDAIVVVRRTFTKLR